MDFFPEPEDQWISYADFLTGVVAIFLFIVVLFVPFIKPAIEKSKESEQSAGNLIVEIGWVGDADVDTWLLAPGDRPVGYSNKGGRVFNLLRDDLGHDYESLNGRHYENAYSRGIPAGEYVVNVHLFRAPKSVPMPLEVEVAVRLARDPKGSKSDPLQIVKSKVKMENEGQEITALRFRLDHEGKVVPGSANANFAPVRNRQ